MTCEICGNLCSDNKVSLIDYHKLGRLYTCQPCIELKLTIKNDIDTVIKILKMVTEEQKVEVQKSFKKWMQK